jgi:hypothetical protein
MIGNETEKDKLSAKSRAFEVLFYAWNSILMSIEMMRDVSHGDTYLPSFNQENIVPLKTEGLEGFFDLHMGSSFETLLGFYISRLPVELLAKAYEKITDKKISSRVKVGISLTISVLAISTAELTGHGGHVSEPLDLFGPILAGIWASTGFLVIEELFGEEKKNIKKGKAIISFIKTSINDCLTGTNKGVANQQSSKKSDSS